MLIAMKDILNSNDNSNAPRWVDWAREIQALAQTGYHYSENDYQRQRNYRLSEIAAEMINTHSKIDKAQLFALFQEQIGYATPRIDVRGVVFRNDSLLMVREKADGGWTLPGGWADVGDVPSEAVEREVYEESGFRVQARSIIGVYDANRIMPIELFHAYKIVFRCDLIGGQGRPSNETSEVNFFDYDDLPKTLSGERTHLRHLEDAFKSMQEINKPTVFD